MFKREEANGSVWLPHWRMAGALRSALNALDLKAVKGVMPFWYEIDGDGVLRAKEGSDDLTIPDASTLRALRAHGATITPTLTTTLTPQDFADRFSVPAERRKMAARIAKEALVHGYDGIDLDLETIALTTDVDLAKKVRQTCTSFCRSMSAGLKTERKTLSITVMPRWSDRYEVWRDKLMPAIYDYPALSSLASTFRVMAYDQHAPNTAPGPIAGHEWVRAICEYTARRVASKHRVELGIPLYGRDWGPASVQSLVYENVEALRKKYPEIQPIYSEKEREQTFSYVSSSGEPHTVWYSDTQAVLDRLALLRAHGFAGAAFWAASYEAPSLWRAVREAALRA